MLNADFSVEDDIIGLTDLRANLTQVVEDVVTEHSQKVIIRNGKPAVVLMNVSDYQAMHDRLLAMELEVSYRMAKEEEKRGALIELDDLAAEFGFTESDFDIRRPDDAAE